MKFIKPSAVIALLIAGFGNVSHGQILDIASYYGTDRVGQYSLSGATINASLITGDYGSTGMAVSGNTIFLARGDGTVASYTTSGTTINSTFLSGLGINPIGMAVSGTNLYISGASSGKIGAVFSTSESPSSSFH